jgi:hypothetical protein
MAIRTRRTSLYFIDPEDDSLVTVGCATSITGLSAPREQLEKTCLEDDDATYEGGIKRPGAASVTLNFDTADASHMRLHELYDEGVNLQFAIGWGDGPPAPAALVPPTVDSVGDFDFPDTRSYTRFEGYVADLPTDFALNTFVTGTMSIQLSGTKTIHPRTAT